jgi:exodeoxyribonuclease VII large subunit
VTFYPRGGDAQLVVEHLEPAGEGALLRAFEQLKAKLLAEGLFDEALKRPIPEVPKGIGIITSPTGAALQDILTTLRRRYPLGSVYLYPVPVQGDAACPSIVRALAELPRLAPVDVIVLARGGGSLEDLWCFNNEALARAIRGCAVPVVTGIGHEVDFTIADFAADLRAPTPTGAAERVSPNLSEWVERLDRLEMSLGALLQDRLQEVDQALRRVQARLDLAHPGRRLQQFTQRLDELGERLAHCGARPLAQRRETLERAAERLGVRLRESLRGLGDRLKTQILLLESLNPQAILQRGYAIVRAADGRLLRDTSTLAVGDALEVVLARGGLGAQITEIKPKV